MSLAFRRGGPRSQIAMAASLQRVMLAISDSWPSGQRIRHITPGYFASGTIHATGSRAPPQCSD
jgi:hypothetical protein